MAELKVYSTQECEVNCLGCLSPKLALFVKAVLFKKWKLLSSDACPDGVQLLGCRTVDDVVCVTCSNGLLLYGNDRLQ